jgi:hypothetical protein
VVRQRSAKPLYTGSNPVAASSHFKGLASAVNPFFSSPIAAVALIAFRNRSEVSNTFLGKKLQLVLGKKLT